MTAVRALLLFTAVPNALRPAPLGLAPPACLCCCSSCSTSARVPVSDCRLVSALEACGGRGRGRSLQLTGVGSEVVAALHHLLLHWRLAGRAPPRLHWGEGW